MVERLSINFPMMRTYDDPNGPFVRYSDYAVLERQIAELRAELAEHKRLKNQLVLKAYPAMDAIDEIAEGFRAAVHFVRNNAMNMDRDYPEICHAEEVFSRASTALSGSGAQPALPLKDEVERVLEEAKAAISSLSGGPNGSCSETIRRLDSSLSRLRAGEQQPTHRHKKRGTGYVLLGFGRMQANNWRDLTEDQDLSDGCEVGKPVDMREVAIYRSVDDGSLWTRPREEFEDGRFEALPAASSEHGGERE